MPGLDPGIHEAAHKEESYDWARGTTIMDCRVKPGNDSW